MKWVMNGGGRKNENNSKERELELNKIDRKKIWQGIGGECGRKDVKTEIKKKLSKKKREEKWDQK